MKYTHGWQRYFHIHVPVVPQNVTALQINHSTFSLHVPNSMLVLNLGAVNGQRRLSPILKRIFHPVHKLVSR
jgi:hypothetical protein